MSVEQLFFPEQGTCSASNSKCANSKESGPFDASEQNLHVYRFGSEIGSCVALLGVFLLIQIDAGTTGAPDLFGPPRRMCVAWRNWTRLDRDEILMSHLPSATACAVVATIAAAPLARAMQVTITYSVERGTFSGQYSSGPVTGTNLLTHSTDGTQRITRDGGAAKRSITGVIPTGPHITQCTQKGNWVVANQHSHNPLIRDIAMRRCKEDREIAAVSSRA